MQSFPKISIITPNYKGEKYLEKTILSVLNQNYPNLEYIVIDGGSTDNSIEIIKKYESQITFWVSEKDKGQSEAINKGFKKATGDIIAFINSDDFYEPNIFNSIAAIFQDKSIDAINGNCRFIYASKIIPEHIDYSGDINTRRMLKYWKPYFCPPQPSIFIRKSVLDAVGYLDESLNFSMDLDLWLRIAYKYNFKYVNELYSNYLIHDESKSGSEDGFHKFMPEWKQVALRHLKNAGFKVKLNFYLSYCRHKFNL